jgi:hypothetical protein
MVWMFVGVVSGATDGADKGYFPEYRSYVTLRDGWLFGGDVKDDYNVIVRPENNRSREKAAKINVLHTSVSEKNS